MDKKTKRNFGSRKTRAPSVRFYPLAGLGANVFVALPRNAPDYTNMIRRRCERVFVFPYGWWRKNEPASDGVRDLFAHLITTHNINAVHTNTIMLRECMRAARACGAASIVHVRELITHDKDLVDIIGLPVEQIVAEVHARADWIIGNSAATAEAFFRPGTTAIIPNTIDVDAMDMANELSGDRIRFGLISSNIPKKGLFDFVEVARRCLTTAPQAEFLIIGPDTHAIDELKASATEGTLPSNIVFTGYAASPKEAISQVNVVLSLSHFAESFGRTVLEAMAARRPVIVYEWGALPELVVHAKTGFLAPYKNIASVATYVQDICASPAKLAPMGEQAREAAVARYGLNSYREAFRHAYAKILPDVHFESPRDLSKPVIRPARLPGLMVRNLNNRIAYFCWHFPVPSETFVLNELRELIARNADVLVFCRQSPYKDFHPDFDIKFERVDSAKTLARRLRETGRTIVHAHFTYPTVTDMVWPACEQAEIPFTFMAHAQDIFVHKNDEKNRLAEIGASKWCLKLFTLSRFHHDYIVERGFPRAKIFINPNAVDTRRFAACYANRKQHRNTRRILAVHRFVEKKGLANLILAAPLLSDLGITIDIYGYGDLENDYRNLIKTNNIQSVTIHGPVTQDRVAELMAQADLFACPAIRTADGNMDGIPTSIVESMVAGLPVLATAISGIADLVEDGITGIICEPTPEGIADAIRRFYALHPLQLRAVVEEAHNRAVARHDVATLVDTLCRVWDNATVDIVIVAWNNLPELRMVVDAILANTALPYHLIICDNLSQKANVFGYLESLWAQQDRVTIIHNNVNAMVGPGTNLAMAQGNADCIIYVCGKEGMSFANGWENEFVRAFTGPEIGLVGTIGYSPSYLTGAQYPQGIRLFEKFRNRQFALDNPDRLFGHIQGGLFAINRCMVEKISGFSDDVPHDYTDVEYSFYAESCGWKIAEAPSVLALFNKSRPTLSQRFREDIKVAHPVLPHQIDDFAAIVAGSRVHCNICDWYGSSFEPPVTTCPHCGSRSEDRSLFRWLSDSVYMYRRLPALGVGLQGKMLALWAEQFQGPRMTVTDFANELTRVGRLPNSPGKLRLAAFQMGEMGGQCIQMVATELKRVLAVGSPVLFQVEAMNADAWNKVTCDVEIAMRDTGFQIEASRRYSGRSAGYSFLPMKIFARS